MSSCSLTSQWEKALEPFGDTPHTRRRVRGSDLFPRTGSLRRCNRLSLPQTPNERVSCSASSKKQEGTRSTADAERGDTAAEFGTQSGCRVCPKAGAIPDAGQKDRSG